MIHSAPTDDLAHHGVQGQTLGVIDVLVPSEPAEYRLTQETGQAVQPIMTSAGIGEKLGCENMQAEHIVQLPRCEDPPIINTR